MRVLRFAGEAALLYSALGQLIIAAAGTAGGQLITFLRKPSVQLEQLMFEAFDGSSCFCERLLRTLDRDNGLVDLR